MDDRITSALKTRFEEDEAGKIGSFLDRGFSPLGEIAVASVFLFATDGKTDAGEKKKIAQAVLNVCETEWERNWQYQHPDIRGNLDAYGDIGMRNRQSIENVYKAIGVTSPLKAVRASVPAGAFAAATRNSVYRFGAAEEDGSRTVSRDGRPLVFGRCKVIFLKIGSDMHLECVDGPYATWRTTRVASVKME